MISDGYLLQWLLDRTIAEPPEIHWRDGHLGGYWTVLAGVRVWLHMVSEVAGSRLVLNMTDDLDEAAVVEPRAGGLLGRKYDSEEEERRARLLRGLFAEAARQVVRRKLASMEMEEAVRERLFRRVLFEDCDSLVTAGRVRP